MKRLIAVLLLIAGVIWYLLSRAEAVEETPIDKAAGDSSDDLGPAGGMTSSG